MMTTTALSRSRILNPIIKLIYCFNYANVHLRCEKVTVIKISHCPPVAPRGEAIASAGDSPHKYHTNCSTARRMDCCNYSENPFAIPRPRGGENVLIYRPDQPAQLFNDGVKQQSNHPQLGGRRGKAPGLPLFFLSRSSD